MIRNLPLAHLYLSPNIIILDSKGIIFFIFFMISLTRPAKYFVEAETTESNIDKFLSEP